MKITIALALLFVFSRACKATPIVIARTSTAIFLGTNASESDGKKVVAMVCKLHMSSDAVVMRAADRVSMVLSKGSDVAASFSLNSELDGELRGKHLPRTELHRLVVQSTENSIKRGLRQFEGKVPVSTAEVALFSSNFAIAGFEHGKSYVDLFQLDVSGEYLDPKFDEKPLALNVADGEQVNWFGGNEPIVVSFGNSELFGPTSVNAALENDKLSGEKSGSFSYEGPFLILRLGADGSEKLLKDELRICK